MNKKSIAKLGLLTLSCALAQTQSAEAKSKDPNILFIIIDDLGIKDLGCYGNRMAETPVIDQLSRESMRFTNAYASPVSSATRTCLISGQNTTRHGVYEVIGCHDRPYARMQSPVLKEEIPEEIDTYADILTAQGYNCGIFGKWHAGRTPEKEGFGGCDVKIKDKELLEYVKTDNVMKCKTITAQSIEFLRENKDKPFCLCVSHFLVHAPLEAPTDLDNKYRKKIRDTGIIDFHPQYLSMVEMVDQSVDMILKELDNLGLSKNTVVVFYSDNGGLEDDMMLVTPLAGCNDPYRDQKGCLYEGGIRVPLMVRWPGKVEAGSECDEPVVHLDLFSTFVELGGGKVPAGQISDGESLVPILKGKKDKLDREALYWHFPTNMWTRSPMGAIRKGDYKLIENFLDGSLELYDVKNDISEIVNLASARPEVTEELYNDLKKWQKETNAQMPTLNPNFDPLREKEMAKDWWK